MGDNTAYYALEAKVCCFIQDANHEQRKQLTRFVSKIMEPDTVRQLAEFLGLGYDTDENGKPLDNTN